MTPMSNSPSLAGAERGERYVSRLTKQTYALILAGGRGSRLLGLTDWRPKPSKPF